MLSPKGQIILVGYSGHAYVVAELAELNGYNLLGYFNLSKSDFNPMNIEFLGSESKDEILENYRGKSACLGIGGNSIRKKIFERLTSADFNLPLLAHPSAVISKSSEFGKGSVIMANVTVNPFTLIGENCILNTSSTIEHNVIIGNHSHIAPGATVLGGVTIGNDCFIGGNAVVKNGLSIADNVIIGAGSVVLNSINEKGTWIGNPAKQLK